MNDFSSADRQTLREYIFDTLSPEARDQVEALILKSPSWQEALEAERAALALLDELQDTAPPGDLAKRTIQAVEEAADEEPEPRWYQVSWQAVALTVALAAIVGAIVLPALSRTREASQRSSTRTEMKQVGLALKMYANESPGELYPPMSPYKDVWMFDLERVYPEYLTDLSALVDDAHPNASEIHDELLALAAQESPDWERMTRLAARSFTYVGWAITSNDDADLLANSFAKLTPEQLDSNLGTDDHRVYRLREGIERFLITDINNPAASAMGQSELPVLIRNAARRRTATDVLYLDGHVDSLTDDDRSTVIDRLLDALPHLSRPD